MATLIKNAKIINNSWQRLDWTADGSLPSVPAKGDLAEPRANSVCGWKATKIRC